MSRRGHEEKQHKLAKVLIADDQRVLADTLGVVLRWSGFQTLLAYSAENAIELAQIEKPDLLITDVVFKGEQLTGIDVALRVQEMLPACKILLFSGDDASASLLAKAQANGHEFQFLQKPVYPQEMLQKLGIGVPTPPPPDALTRKGPVPVAGGR
jgi:DNA-binding NtrC family response regulator